jgi:hypothetical protein
MSFFDFCYSLCASLIWYSHLDEERLTRKRRSACADDEGDEEGGDGAGGLAATVAKHSLLPLSSHQTYKDKENSVDPDMYRARNNCHICGTASSHYCEGCGDPEHGMFMAYCNSPKDVCFAQHIIEVLQEVELVNPV